MARIPSRVLQQRETKAAVSAPAPAPASSKRTVRGSGPNIEAMKSATRGAVRNCPSSARCSRVFCMAALCISYGCHTSIPRGSRWLAGAHAELALAADLEPPWPKAWKRRSRKICACPFSSPVMWACAHATKAASFSVRESGIFGENGQLLSAWQASHAPAGAHGLWGGVPGCYPRLISRTPPA